MVVSEMSPARRSVVGMLKCLGGKEPLMYASFVPETEINKPT